MRGFDANVLQRLARGLFRILVVAALFLYALWPWLPSKHSPHRPRTLVFYGFSILDEVMTKAVLPAFQREWLARTGERQCSVAVTTKSWSSVKVLYME